MFTLPILIIIGLVVWLFGRPAGTPQATIEELKMANHNLKQGMKAMMEVEARGGHPSVHDITADRVKYDLNGWEHPSTHEVRNWLVSRGFWRCEIAGIPAYTNGKHTWTVTPERPEGYVGDSALMAKPTYRLRQTKRYSPCPIRYYSDATDAMDTMLKQEQHASQY